MFLRQRFASTSLPTHTNGGRTDNIVGGAGRHKQKMSSPKIPQLIIIVMIGCCWLHSISGSNNINDGGGSISSVLQVDKKQQLQSNRQMKEVQNGLETRNWSTFTSSQLKRYFGCSKLFKTPRPIITKRNWIYFRDLYNQFLEENLHIDNGNGNVDGTYKVTEKVATHPVEGTFTIDKGRGLIASRNIKRGELIFTGTNNTIVFETGHAWRKFLWYLYHAPPTPDPYPEGFACDIKSWSWIQYMPNQQGLKIMVDIDESSLLNQPSSGERANIQCGKLNDKNAECELDYYARKDIKKGDEILCRYSDFAEGGWDIFGL